MKSLLPVLILTAWLAGCTVTAEHKQPNSIVSIETIVSGASTDAIESLVVARVERALRNLEGVDTVRSIASPGRSYIEVQFKTGDKAQHLSLVREAVDAVQPALPSQTTRSVIANRDVPALK